ncbi:hydrogenase nickel incorporation protein HypB [Antrihabitans stalactiti]|uniref:Hydrogenase nickel incorporation protein HypB n=1 Tax=Antrihabitans stalactiti TaxID=2584121 RepID=A0A848KNB6_9NOCA|nr:hydrogenase nickel incorporation protein HypB [Antrihabitans stalactiti]NMN99376.1 hydrogenase nickel incorporation protein HypB [Antrihabitans stalactiti]
MCATCGCGDDDGVVITVPHDHSHEHDHVHEHGDDHSHDHVHDHSHSHDHVHDHSHGHDHDHDHDHGHTETITLEQKVLAKNDLLAERNRGWLAGRGIVALNMMSSPGSGKTTLLARTIREMSSSRPIAVIEGDQETTLDADRIKSAGASVVQVNTGAGCHLDAEMMQNALTALDPPTGSLLFIENVGNLVCPALFDLGERARVVVVSVTEGTDKPLKYPHMFGAADLVIVNKVDLLPYVDFDVAMCEKYARSINPGLELMTLSATTGEGIDRWYEWVEDRTT